MVGLCLGIDWERFSGPVSAEVGGRRASRADSTQSAGLINQWWVVVPGTFGGYCRSYDFVAVSVPPHHLHWQDGRAREQL